MMSLHNEFGEKLKGTNIAKSQRKINLRIKLSLEKN